MFDEGVIKFRADHTRSVDAVAVRPTVIAGLRAWRTRLFDLALIGQDQDRYGGAGFGNVSVRLPDGTFVITGTQTGEHRFLGRDLFVHVLHADPFRNTVRSVGPVPPSSESMTHAALYEANPATQAVFHVHSPVIWNKAAALNLPCARKDVPYGTPDMAHEVWRLLRESSLPTTRVFSMPGHEDGVVSFGASLDEAGDVLLATLQAARRM